LTNYIYPAITKLSEENNDNENVLSALNQLRTVFTDVETNKAGITHKLIVHIIETLKK